MKLLLDQNISFRVVPKLKPYYPEATSVREKDLYEKDDRAIWEFCRQQGYTIVTFDEDLYNLTTLYGPPPKIIWLKTGNLTNDEVAELLLRYRQTINDFLEGPDTESCLAIFKSGTISLP